MGFHSVSNTFFSFLGLLALHSLLPALREIHLIFLPWNLVLFFTPPLDCPGGTGTMCVLGMGNLRKLLLLQFCKVRHFITSHHSVLGRQQEPWLPSLCLGLHVWIAFCKHCSCTGLRWTSLCAQVENCPSSDYAWRQRQQVPAYFNI